MVRASAPITRERPATDSTSVWAAHYSSGLGFRYWPCEELVRSVAGRRFGTIVEPGCGNGANLWLLAEHADRVIGVDSNRVALDAAAAYMETRRVSDRVTVLQGSVTNLPVAAGQADAIVDSMVSQHWPYHEHAEVYREYRRALRPGGWLFLYHLIDGTTAHGGMTTGSPWTFESLPMLFPDAGLTCLPPVWALGDAMRVAGFKVSPHRAVTKHYADRQTAMYAVIEGEAV